MRTKELAAGAYGRLKDHVQHEIRPYKYTEEDMLKRIAEIEQKLGYSKPQVLPPANSDSEPN